MYGLPESDERKYHRKKVKERMMSMQQLNDQI
jgi:hypothetical protein